AYEVSNFARPARASRHNQAYWDGRAYLGLGSGAHSYLPPERWWNVRDWHEYAARVGQNASPVADSERVDGAAAALERVWLGLRQRTGLGADALNAPQAKLVGRWE